MACGLEGFYTSYSMNNWNSQLNEDVVNGFGEYAYSGSPVSSGLGLTLDFRYFLNDDWSLGGFLDYMSAGGTFKSVWVDASGEYDETGSYSFPAIFVGPQTTYTFYRPLPNLKLAALGGIGYLTLLGANENYTYAQATSSGTSAGSATATLSGGGFGVKVAVEADFALTSSFSLTSELGYRMASIGTVTSSVGGTLQRAGSNVALDYSGFILDIGLAYWR